MTTITLTSDHLFRAAEILDEKGWKRGSVGADDGPCCMVGAIGEAIEGYRTYPYDQQHEIAPLVKEVLGHGYLQAVPHLYQWNDHYAKDKRQVQRKLRRMARILRRREHNQVPS